MRIAAIVRCFHLTKYLKKVLENLKDLDLVLVMNSRFIGVEDAKDDTGDIVFKMKQKNLSIYKGEPERQHRILNRGLEVLKNYDYVFINDADEFILPDDRKQILNDMKEKNTQVAFCPVVDYKDLSHIYPLRDHKPVVCVRPAEYGMPQDKFYQIRNIMDASGSRMENVYVHHFGYALDDKDLEWKKKNLYKDESPNVWGDIINRKIVEYDPIEKIKEIING